MEFRSWRSCTRNKIGSEAEHHGDPDADPDGTQGSDGPG